MKQTLSTGQAADILLRDQYAGWSYNGAYALVEHLEQYEEDCGEELEMDVVAIRCEFTEYTSALECAREYGMDWVADLLDDDGNERDEDEVLEETETYALEWLQDRTTVIEFDGGIIVGEF